MRKLFFAALAALLLIASCSREMEPEIGATTDEPVPALALTPTPLNWRTDFALVNPENPYETLGNLHNEICEQLIANYNMSDASTVKSSIDAYVAATYNVQDVGEFYEDNGVDMAVAPTVAELSADWAADPSLSAQGWNLMNDLHSAFGAFSQGMNKDIVDGYLAAVTGIESTVLTTPLSNKEKKYLLCTSSIYKHSATLWYSFTHNKIDGIGALGIASPDVTIDLVPSWLAADAAAAQAYMHSGLLLASTAIPGIGTAGILGLWGVFSGGMSLVSVLEMNPAGMSGPAQNFLQASSIEITGYDPNTQTITIN